MILNNDTLNSLIEILGEDDIHELIQIYLKSTPETIKNIKIAVQNEDSEKARFWGHRLKGASGTLGFEEMQTIGQQIELLASEQNLSDIQEYAPKLTISLHEIKEKIQKNFPQLIIL